MSLKRRLYDCLEMGAFGYRAGVLFDRAMVVLIIANVLAVAAESVPALGEAYGKEFQAFEVFSIAIFTIEYVARLWVATEARAGSKEAPWRRRLRYMLSPLAIIDLLAIAPFYFAPVLAGLDLRFLRIFRLLRLLKLVHSSPALASLARLLYAERRALLAALVIMLGVLFFAATMLYFLERKVQPEAFASIPHALWWAIGTLTTVGYGDVVPVTLWGRIVGGGLMMSGLAFYAFPVGIVAAAFSNEIHRRDFVIRYSLVTRVPLFEGMPPEVIAEVGRLMQPLNVEEGAVISHKGHGANGMYFLVSGEAIAQVAGREVVLRKGVFFGEISLLKESFRNITVVARTKCRLMMLESHDFQHLMVARPGLRNRLRQMVKERLALAVRRGDITEDEMAEILTAHDVWQKSFGRIH